MGCDLGHKVPRTVLGLLVAQPQNSGVGWFHRYMFSCQFYVESCSLIIMHNYWESCSKLSYNSLELSSN